MVCARSRPRCGFGTKAQRHSRPVAEAANVFPDACLSSPRPQCLGPHRGERFTGGRVFGFRGGCIHTRFTLFASQSVCVCQ